jgi:hypothetical protein
MLSIWFSGSKYSGKGSNDSAVLQLERQHVQVDAVALVQLRARDALQALLVALVQRELFGARGRIDAHADLVVEAVIAVLRRADRLVAGQRVVVFIGQGEELPGGGVRHGGRDFGRRRGGLYRRIGHQQCGAQGGQGQAVLHLWIPWIWLECKRRQA